MKAIKQPSKATITIKADPQITRRARVVARKSGSTLSSVLNDYMVEIARLGRVHGEEEPRLRPEIEKQLFEAEKDYHLGRNISPSLRTAKELRDYLSKL